MQVVKDHDTVDIVARSIQHINSIGAIIDNRLLIHNYGGSLMDIGSIRKLEIHKTTGTLYSLILFLSAMPLVYTLFTIDYTQLEKLLVMIFIMLLVGFAIFIRKPKYTLFIKKVDTECIALPVNKYQKDAAKRMVRLVNKKIKQSK